ncbi:MAG: zinc-dependent metalloprotease [Actinomycetota bacterium]|nr:zinc-dependent metalloprotease [Actinomycetota bacterium]
MSDTSAPDPGIVDWAIARRVGRVVAGTGYPIPLSHRPALRAQFAQLVGTADRLVRDYTQLEPPEPAGTPVVFGRAGWIDANIEGFRGLMRPVTEKIGQRTSGVTRKIGGAALGVQMGILLGYLAQKVLGQYDLLLAGGGKGKVYFVAPNIVAAEQRWELDGDDFRLWIALHEVTHRTQFVAVPWLRDRVASLIERYIGAVELDPAKLRSAVSRLLDTLRKGPEAWKRANIMNIFLTPSQQEVVGEMQSLMTVVEGHGNFVMDGVGAQKIPSFDRMKSSLAAQRQMAGAAERTFQRAIGLDMKYQQYSRGEQFVAKVAEQAGMTGVNRLWERPENLPTLEELEKPSAWLARVSPPESLERGAQ